MRTITTAFLLAVQYKRLAVESRQKTVVEELLCSFLLLALESLSPICFLHKSGRDAAVLQNGRMHLSQFHFYKLIVLNFWRQMLLMKIFFYDLHFLKTLLCCKI